VIKVAGAPKTWIRLFQNSTKGISRSILRFLQPFLVPIFQGSVLWMELQCQEHIKDYAETLSYNRIMHNFSYMLILLLHSAILLKAVSRFQCAHYCRSTRNAVMLSTTCISITQLLHSTSLHSFSRTRSFHFSNLKSPMSRHPLALGTCCGC
jgi:hypothetical protein